MSEMNKNGSSVCKMSKNMLENYGSLEMESWLSLAEMMAVEKIFIKKRLLLPANHFYWIHNLTVFITIPEPKPKKMKLVYQPKANCETWVPPVDQSGDGSTDLNKKLGY